jgi:hypothetical protein
LERARAGRERLAYLAMLAVITPLGFATKFYHGPGHAWVADHAGGLLYVTFWILLAMLLAPQLPVRRVAAGVLLVTCILEFLQLWHPPLLERVRATFLGRALIGSDFDWGDFPYYFLGALAGYGLARRAQARPSPRPSPTRSGP